MHAFSDLVSEDLIDPALPLNTVHTLESGRNDRDSEMGFAAFPVRRLSGMMVSRVKMGFIHDLQPMGLESRGKLGSDGRCDTHRQIDNRYERAAQTRASGLALSSSP